MARARRFGQVEEPARVGAREASVAVCRSLSVSMSGVGGGMVAKESATWLGA